ncbi:MAG: GNAT family N-acetyltransferase [Chloroflexota bacterium]|nr:GNAT family N-acetyltransferase [Chloroflexota bacterium]
MAQITTRPVNEANWRAALALDVYPHQRDFTPSVAVSLAKAYIQPDGVRFDPVAIYAGATMVGFYSFITIPDDWHACYLGGFLIDHNHQGRGYGRAALVDFLASVRRTRPQSTDVLLTVHPHNRVAERLYTRLGFVKTGDAIDGEDVMRLVLGK